MGMFDLFASMQKMADDPALGNAAAAIGKAAAEIPAYLKQIDQSLKFIAQGQSEQTALLREIRTDNSEAFEQREKLKCLLVEISQSLDNFTDPIKRPPFGIVDIEAAMAGQWPPTSALDCTPPPTLDDEIGKR